MPRSERLAGAAYSLMRVVFAFLYLCHGLMWLFGAFGGPPKAVLPLPPHLIAAGIIETVGGTLMIAGLFTSWVAFIASGEMAVAYFMVHAPSGFFPIGNRGEITVALCFGFLYMAAHGDGPISLGALRALSRSRR